MARTVRIGDFQRMQRASQGPNHLALGKSDVAGDRDSSAAPIADRDPLTGQLVDAAPIERNPDWRVAVRDRLVDVAPDGIVEGVRPSEMTPDRGEGVGTTVHRVTDEEPRFSGGRSDDSMASDLIPSDFEFSGKLYLDSESLANIAEELIQSKDYFQHLAHCEIRYAWKRKTGTTKRRRQTGGLKRGSDWFGQLLGADFGIYLAADTARERQFTERHIRRYLTHELLKIGQDDHGNFVEQAPTLQVFAPEITEYADVADPDLLIGRRAFSAAEQMGLFDDSDDEDDDEGEDVAEEVIRQVDEEEPDTSGELPTAEEIDDAMTDRELV